MSGPLVQEGLSRRLEAAEIKQLQQQGCWAEDWSQVLVAPGFQADRVHQARFFGRNRLGAFQQTVLLPGGLEHPTGVYQATLYETTVGDEALVRNVRRHVAHCDIEAQAVIEDVELLAAVGESGYGNGVECHVLVETGSRSVPLYDRLSAPVAWLLLFWAEGTPARRRWLEAIAQYAQSRRGVRVRVGQGAWITGCGTLQNVQVGPHARLCGVLRATNGTVHSQNDAPSYLGQGVVADHFIVAAGARVDSGAQLECSFVGQGAMLQRGFSATHSLIFANCDLAHGEATSTLAGPFTVSHHRSSLLIAGAFLFFNAGSATNESNHWYKLGPGHHGTLGRGSKTASDCYMRWPCHVGPFTIVAGRHYGPLDVRAFPFSYLLNQQGKSILLPGANLGRVGPWRDEQKWPGRDRRTGSDHLDWYQTELLNPFTVGLCRQALRRLQTLESAGEAARETIPLHGVHIPGARVRKAMAAYRLAVELYLGDQLARRLEPLKNQAPEPDRAQAARLLERLLQHAPEGRGDWVDLGGLLLPRPELARLLEWFDSGQPLEQLAALELHLASLHQRYAEMAWGWTVELWAQQREKTPAELDWSDVLAVLATWQQALEQYRGMVLQDAQAELEALHNPAWDSADRSPGGTEPLANPTIGKFLQQLQARQQLAHELVQWIITWAEG